MSQQQAKRNWCALTMLRFWRVNVAAFKDRLKVLVADSILVRRGVQTFFFAHEAAITKVFAVTSHEY